MIARTPPKTEINLETLATLIPEGALNHRPPYGPAAYVYKAALWHKNCVAASLYAQGLVSDTELTMGTADDIVEGALQENGLNPSNEYEWDSDQYPKAAFEIYNDDTCDLCLEIIDDEAEPNPDREWE